MDEYEAWCRDQLGDEAYEAWVADSITLFEVALGEEGS